MLVVVTRKIQKKNTAKGRQNNAGTHHGTPRHRKRAEEITSQVVAECREESPGLGRVRGNGAVSSFLSMRGGAGKIKDTQEKLAGIILCSHCEQRAHRFDVERLFMFLRLHRRTYLSVEGAGENKLVLRESNMPARVPTKDTRARQRARWAARWAAR